MKFRDYQIGFADAAKEYIIIPEIFEKAFYDPRGIIDQLLNKWAFMLVGRKGVGKSAFSSKIQSLSNGNNNIFSTQIMLNDFEFSTFAKTKIDNDVTGTQKYKSSWEFILLIAIYKIIYADLGIKEVESFNKMVYLLDEIGFPIELNYKRNISTLSKLKLGTNLGLVDAGIEREFGVKPDSYLERISLLTENMIKLLSDIYYRDEKIIISIDGVDDILRFKKNQLEILSSLIRSVDYLNEKFLKNKLPIKIIIFIREDIVSSVTDPDINKIKRDGSILLSWANRLDDLKCIVNLRFLLSGLTEEQLDSHWERIFPRKIRGKDSWMYILEYTLYKPRDVLQFLKCCQDNYPDKDELGFSEMQNVLKIYSKEYFIEEMKNEITGYVDDFLINILPSVFRKMGRKDFALNELKRIVNEQSVSKEYSELDIKSLLQLLFEAGYIGQKIKGLNKKESIIFKYRNTTASIDFSQKFITHKGLHIGLGIRL